MGLLDFLGAGMDDPKTMASLALAQGLLSGRGGAQGLLHGMQGYTGTLAAAREAARRQQMEDRAAALQEALGGMRLDEAKAAAAMRQKAEAQSGVDTAAMRDQFAPLPGPTQDGSGLSPLFDPRRMLGQGASPQAVQQALGLQAAMQKPEVPLLKGSPGDAFFDPRNPKGGPVFSVPEKAEKTPEALRVLAAVFGEGSPEYINAARQYAQKMTTHSPAVSVVTMGSPVPVTLPDGTQALVQPANRPGEPPQIMRIPGSAEPLRPPPKEMPAAMAEKFAQNAVTLGKIDKAIELVESNPGALGVKNYAPDAIVQRVDPKGVPTRAMVADIAGQKIHDRSGAAVTVGEAERLRPYIPAATDSPTTAAQKLKLFRAEYEDMQRALASGASIRQAASRGDVRPAAIGTKPAPTQADLEYTARKHGITVDEVKRRMGGQ